MKKTEITATNEKENTDEFQDLHELVEAEGLGVDQDIDITDLENERKRK